MTKMSLKRKFEFIQKYAQMTVIFLINQNDNKVQNVEI
jgi:hypothetical protein